MFVQLIKGHTSDADGLRRQAERWYEDVRPGAVGFLGTTAGIADDGAFVALARFTDEASARANSQRPAQGEWWKGMAKHFDGEVTFRESTDVTLLFDGGSDDAGFVQVMEGAVKDRSAADAFMTPEMAEGLRAARPDLLGAVMRGSPTGPSSRWPTSRARRRPGRARRPATSPDRSRSTPRCSRG